MKHSLMILTAAASLALAGCCSAPKTCPLKGVKAESIPAEKWNAGTWTKVGKANYTLGENSLKLQAPGWVTARTGYPFAGTDPAKVVNGISFKVRGDGSDEWGCFGIGDGGPRRSACYFPLKSKEWTTVTIAFADMAPAHDNGARLPDTITAGELNSIYIGDIWSIKTGNMPRPDFSFEIADIKLETKAPVIYQRGKYRPAPLADAIAKMKAGKPVSISCFGDSITAGTSLRNRAATRYATLLGPALAKFYKNDQIKSACVATGGAHTYHSIGWLERDFAEFGTPDVVTMLIGYNNCSGSQTAEFFREQLIEWIERVTFLTQGKCAILLIPTIPGVPRFHTQEYMAAETRKIAEEYGCTVIPLDTIIRDMGAQEYTKFLADSVHPNEAGHEFFTDVIYQTITGEKR